MDLLHQVESILAQEGYQILSDGETGLVFENDTLFGFVRVHDNGLSIIDHWQDQESAFLTTNAPGIRSSGDKSWNAYSIFITSHSENPHVRSQLSTIEEDFVATRKIARCEIDSNEDLLRALSPLLSIRNLITLEQFDHAPRLLSRLSFLSSEEVAALINGADAELLSIATVKAEL